MKRFWLCTLAFAALGVTLQACGNAAPEAAPPRAEVSPPDPAGEGPEVPPFMPFGIPECDKFVDKYVACVDARVPEGQKDRLMRDLHVHRARWRELEKMQDGRLAASLSCRGVAQRLKRDLIVDFGCEF